MSRASPLDHPDYVAGIRAHNLAFAGKRVAVIGATAKHAGEAVEDSINLSDAARAVVDRTGTSWRFVKSGGVVYCVGRDRAARELRSRALDEYIVISDIEVAPEVIRALDQCVLSGARGTGRPPMTDDERFALEMAKLRGHAPPAQIDEGSIDLGTATGQLLDAIARHYDTERHPFETDASMRSRIMAHATRRNEAHRIATAERPSIDLRKLERLIG